MDVFLGIDVGTSATKTLAIDHQGRVLAEASAAYPLSRPRPLWSEQNPDDWWQATVRTVREIGDTLSVTRHAVRAIGLSGQMHGSVFLDARQRVLRPAILWNDQRTAEECEQIVALAGGLKRLVQAVANPALTGFTAPKILWLRNREPRLERQVRHVLLPKDEIRRRLTGELATDVSDASGTLLFDVRRRKWSRSLLEKLEIDPAWLPPCYESEEVTGKLTSEAARLLGLSTDCLVVAGAGDCAASAVGCSIVSPGDVLISTGTSGVVFAHAEEPHLDPLGRLHTFCHAVRGAWHLMGVTLSAGGSFDWFAKSLFPEQAAEQGDAWLARLGEEAATAPAGSDGLFFLPYLAGERTPHKDPNARGCFIGLTASHSRSHLTRAVMEGVCYSLRDSLEIMAQLGVPIRRLRLAGGGAKSRIWRQIQADILGKPLRGMAVEEGPAYGVALLAAVGAKAFPDIRTAVRKAVREKETCKPSSASRHYADRYPVFAQLYPALADAFVALSAVPDRH